MNKPFDPKKPGKAVAVDAPQVPAQPRLPSKWKQIRRLTDDADEIRERFDELGELMVELRKRKPGEPPPDLRYAQLLDCDKQQIARCHQRLDEIDCADHYEESDEDDEQLILRKKIISERLALMVGAVHIGGPQTPEVFLKMLLEHVFDAEPSYLALESGCWQIEQTQKYVPTISEVLKVLKAHEEQWDKRKWAPREIEWRTNYLQEQIREAQAKCERERTEKRLDKAKNLLQRDVWQINNEQGRACQAHQNVESAMDQLENDRAILDAAVAAPAPVPALPQLRSEWQQFRILMDDLDEVRKRYLDLLSQLYGRPGGEPPPGLRYAHVIGFYKRKIARCRQWLPEIDRADYYEEAIGDDGPFSTSRRLLEDTISKRLSAALDTVHIGIGGPQKPEIFQQNLSRYVYGAEVSYLVLESACREIEQTGKYPMISEVLEVLKKHREQWDKRRVALLAIEAVQEQYAGKRFKETEDLLCKRQEEARQAYQQVRAAMDRLAKDQQQFDQAKAALDAVVAKSKQPRTCCQTKSASPF